MALRTVKLLATDASTADITILWDGTEVQTGAVTPVSRDGAWAGPGPDDEEGFELIGTWTFEDDDDGELHEHTLSVTVNSGSLNLGSLWFSTDGVNSEDASLGSKGITESFNLVGAGFLKPYPWPGYATLTADDDPNDYFADRSNILINGSAPVIAEGYTPTGPSDAPTYLGWFFGLEAGDVFTCSARCPAIWSAW